jgi:hypothetical protein
MGRARQAQSKVGFVLQVLQVGTWKNPPKFQPGQNFSQPAQPKIHKHPTTEPTQEKNTEMSWSILKLFLNLMKKWKTSWDTEQPPKHERRWSARSPGPWVQHEPQHAQKYTHPVCVSVCLPLCMMNVCMAVCLPACLYVCMSACVFVGMSVRT